MIIIKRALTGRPRQSVPVLQRRPGFDRLSLLIRTWAFQILHWAALRRLLHSTFRELLMVKIPWAFTWAPLSENLSLVWIFMSPISCWSLYLKFSRLTLHCLVPCCSLVWFSARLRLRAQQSSKRLKCIDSQDALTLLRFFSILSASILSPEPIYTTLSVCKTA